MTEITKDMVIADLLDTDIAEEAMPILQSMGMHCLGCVMANQETIEEACMAHDLDTDEVVSQLLALLRK